MSATHDERQLHLEPDAPNIGIQILLQPLQRGDDLVLDDLEPRSVVLQNRSQDFERLGHVESDVGDLVVA